MSGGDEQIAYRRIKKVSIGDAIDDRTGETQVVLVLEALTEGDDLKRFHFALPPEKAQALGKLLLWGKTKPYQKH